jgi:hypothetical protein
LTICECPLHLRDPGSITDDASGTIRCRIAARGVKASWEADRTTSASSVERLPARPSHP